MRTTAVALSYAKVLFSLANNMKMLDVVNKEIQILGGVCQKMSRLFALIDKQASVDTKNSFLTSLKSHGGFNEVIIKFLDLIRLENKFSLLFEISEAFTNLYRKDKNIAVVKVTSVEVIDDKTKKNIVKVLNDILKKEIIIDNVVDQGIIGGVVIEIGSYVIDSSFENVLRRIKLSTNDI